MEVIDKLENKYRKKLKETLNDDSINQYNRDLFKEFFLWQEDKLEHGNSTARLGEGNYKTLYDYISKLKNVNKWFDNKAWNKLTEDDIKKVRRKLIDGKILNTKGEKYRDIRSYVSKIFKYKPFALAGQKENVEKVFEFSLKTKRKDVRYVTPDSAKKIIMAAKSYSHKALFCLAWDIGENVNSLLQLKKKWVKPFVDKETGKKRYSIYFPNEILKESRTSRTEITLFDETVDAIDKLIQVGNTIQQRNKKGSFTGKYSTTPFKEDDLLFNFQYARAKDLFNEYVIKTNTTCEPNGEKPTLKDFRSGMACNLFDLGWDAQDVNLRLGHSALSTQFDVYVNYKGLNRKKSIRKYDKLTLSIVEERLEESESARERQEIRHTKEIETLQKTINKLWEENKQTGQFLADFGNELLAIQKQIKKSKSN